MRVRYEYYKNGLGTGQQCKCDLPTSRAIKLFNELKQLGNCGWAELVAEEDDEGEYMEILDSFDHIQFAKQISTII